MKASVPQSIYNAIISLLRWFAGFFQGVKNEASSKRAMLYIAAYLLYSIVNAAENGKWENNSINMQLQLGIIVIILFGIDAIKKESISKIIESKFGVKDIETENKKVSTVDKIETQTN